MKLIAKINLENIEDNLTSDFEFRRAARAIVFDENELVALLPVTKHNYYKLPGGGIEGEENIIEAAKRECLEEIGCEVEIIKELGEILEYLPKINFKQTSYCYIAKLSNSKGSTNFTQSEIDEGFEKPIWLTLPDAIDLISKSKPNNYTGPFRVARDLAFLEETLRQL